MFNESDTHSGCESCGKILTVHYTRNIGFYCDDCLFEEQERNSHTEQNILIENISSYIAKSIDKKLSKSNFYYFKKKYLNLFLSLTKCNRRRALTITISNIRALEYYSECNKTFFLESKTIINSITNLLIVNRNTIKI